MNLEELKKKHLADSEVKKEYDKLEPEFQLIRSIIDARHEEHLTQQQLADRTGIDRADISKLENGNANPSLKLLKRLAEGLNREIKIEFIPK